MAFIDAVNGITVYNKKEEKKHLNFLWKQKKNTRNIFLQYKHTHYKYPNYVMSMFVYLLLTHNLKYV